MKKYRGTALIEMTYIMPVVLLVWISVIFLLFYFHDKNIISGAAYETAVVGSELYHRDEKIDENILTTYFHKRIENKLLFFSGADPKIRIEEDKIYVRVDINEKKMKLSVQSRAELSIPEREVRKIRVWKERIEGMTQ